MSIEQLESKLMALPREERQQFAQWFYDHEHEIVGIAGDRELSREAQEEILRRREELRTKPGLAIPVTEEWFIQLKQKLASARSTKAPAR